MHPNCSVLVCRSGENSKTAFFFIQSKNCNAEFPPKSIPTASLLNASPFQLWSMDCFVCRKVSFSDNFSLRSGAPAPSGRRVVIQRYPPRDSPVSVSSRERAIHASPYDDARTAVRQSENVLSEDI